MAFKYTEEQLNKLDKELLIHLFLGMQEQMEELTRQTQSLNDKSSSERIYPASVYKTDTSHLPGRRKTSRSFIRRKACPASTGGETTSGCFLCVPKIK